VVKRRLFARDQPIIIVRDELVRLGFLLNDGRDVIDAEFLLQSEKFGDVRIALALVALPTKDDDA